MKYKIWFEYKILKTLEWNDSNLPRIDEPSNRVLEHTCNLLARKSRSENEVLEMFNKNKYIKYFKKHPKDILIFFHTSPFPHVCSQDGSPQSP